jgi:ApaG protein
MANPRFDCVVTVAPLPEHTQDGEHAFAYTVSIRNSGDVTAQLVARRWLIVDAHGRSEEVRGLAVVGKQPVLKPGEAFEYTSWTRLATPVGTMRGTFYCMTENAQPFEADVPEFLLSASRPEALH